MPVGTLLDSALWDWRYVWRTPNHFGLRWRPSNVIGLVMRHRLRLDNIGRVTGGWRWRGSGAIAWNQWYSEGARRNSLGRSPLNCRVYGRGMAVRHGSDPAQAQRD